MIRKLTIDNFKSVNNVEMPCANLNLLVGTNSSGKSTILQALLLFAQHMSKSQGLSGYFVSLGTYDEIKCVYSGKTKVQISVVTQEGEDADIELEKYDNGYSIKKNPLNVKAFADKFDYEQRQIQYLSCHRIGPQNLYKKNMNMIDTIGIDGSYAISYLNMHASDPLDNKMCKNTQDFTLAAQVNWWLKYIIDTEVKTEEIAGADMIKASYLAEGGIQIRPQNVGSGISYLISIIITCFAAPEESIIVIENPEIHLHPAAQSRVCDFLYFISKNNRQLFVETHSDHIFNGYRAMIATGEMSSSDININFVYLNEQHMTEIELVKFGRFGRIENQRENLFDQFDIDLNKMIGV